MPPEPPRDSSKANLAPAFIPYLNRLEDKCLAAGLSVKMTEGRRTLERQAFLYGKGRTAAQLTAAGVDPVWANPSAGKVTNAKPGQSNHHSGYAADYVLLDAAGHANWNGDWPAFGRCVRAVGLTWGGDFKRLKDYAHVELPKALRPT